MGISLATAVIFSAIVGTGAAVFSTVQSGKAQKRALRAQSQQQTASLASLSTSQTNRDIEAKQAKDAADKRSADLEAGIKADTADELAKRRRSLAGLSSTVRTSPRGLTTVAPTEKKTLLGQGGRV